MTKKWILINLLLLVIAVFAGWQLYASVQQFKKDNDLSKIKPAGSSLNQKTAQDTSLPAEIVPGYYSPMEFALIPEKNVFTESRSREASPDTPTVTGNIPNSQKPVLVGVVLSDKQKVASIQPPAERGRVSQIEMMEIGDSYEGYTVTDIKSDHIVLTSGNLKETIYLNDSSQPAQRTKTRIEATQVIPIGGTTTAAANTSTYVVLDRNNRAAPGRVIQMPQAQDVGASGTQRNIIMVSPAGQPGTQPTTVLSPQTNQTPDTNQGGATTRRSRVIPSPFGDITRNPQN